MRDYGTGHMKVINRREIKEKRRLSKKDSPTLA